MAKILVKNGDWSKARADLKTSLAAQNAVFSANLKAAFAPPNSKAEDTPAAPEKKPAEKSGLILSRSRRV